MGSGVLENARLLGASRWAAWTKIAVPYSAVWVFTGIRIGLPYALIGAVVGEFVAANSGVGFRVKEATSFFNTASVFAGADGHQPDAVGRFEPEIERRVLRWQTANVLSNVEATA